MAIMAECPVCHRKQATSNKQCKCGEDLDKAKRSKKVRYWVKYRDENGKQGKKTLRNDPSSYSIEAVRDLERKLVAQKRENKLSASLNEKKTTFAELSEWYLKLESVKALASYPIIKFKLKIFNKDFGEKKISEVKFSDLESFQISVVPRPRAGIHQKVTCPFSVVVVKKSKNISA
jgi:hypothetical protein